MLRRMPELGFHAAQNVIDVSAVVALSLCLLKINILVRSGIPDHHLNSRDLEFLGDFHCHGHNSCKNGPIFKIFVAKQLVFSRAFQ